MYGANPMAFMTSLTYYPRKNMVTLFRNIVEINLRFGFGINANIIHLTHFL